MNTEDEEELRAWRQLSVRLHTQAIEGAEPLYPVPEWPKDVALVGFMLHKGLQKKEEPAPVVTPPEPKVVDNKTKGCVQCKFYVPPTNTVWCSTKRRLKKPWWKFKFHTYKVYKQSGLEYGFCSHPKLTTSFDKMTGEPDYHYADSCRTYSCSAKGLFFEPRAECDKLLVE